MSVEHTPLPYALDALAPHMSQQTLEFHWGKHHKTYVDNLNKQLAGGPLEKESLLNIVKASWNEGKPQPTFNNAAQAWNHAFFWESMCSDGGGKPSGPLAEAIDKSFGSYEKFAQEFKAAGATQFGSGWAWLVSDKSGAVSVTKSANAESPVTSDNTIPLLTMDVWEHAYYLDYQNKRPEYMGVFLEKLVNWKKVEERYSSCCK